ncbi:hypothetical protein GCM10020366_67990 [Saccharopolyspora gregorii]|uniref:Uncharacterized protein n=1 Tax=Saccharopolyspora gregorii TaxID=33914 RepID=A0ABP6S274_9PSEU
MGRAVRLAAHARRALITVAAPPPPHRETTFASIILTLPGGTAMTRLATNKLALLTTLLMGWILTLFIIIAQQG